MNSIKPVTREQARDMSDAHADGLHDEMPREGCPDCEDRPLRSYPTADSVEKAPMSDALTEHEAKPEEEE